SVVPTPAPRPRAHGAGPRLVARALCRLRLARGIHVPTARETSRRLVDDHDARRVRERLALAAAASLPRARTAHRDRAAHWPHARRLSQRARGPRDSVRAGAEPRFAG